MVLLNRSTAINSFPVILTREVRLPSSVTANIYRYLNNINKLLCCSELGKMLTLWLAIVLVHASCHSWHCTPVKSAAFTMVFMVFVSLSCLNATLVYGEQMDMFRIRCCLYCPFQTNRPLKVLNLEDLSEL